MEKLRIYCKRDRASKAKKEIKEERMEKRGRNKDALFIEKEQN